MAEQQGPETELLDDEGRLFLTWTPPAWVDPDGTTVGLFSEPPLVANDRIVNADRALVDAFTFAGGGSHRVRVREILGESVGEPIAPGIYYWAVWQHADGAVVVFSDVEAFQVQEVGTRLQQPGVTCRHDADCWQQGDEPVACMAGVCEFVCAGSRGDCASARCRVDDEPPPWTCASD